MNLIEQLPTALAEIVVAFLHFFEECCCHQPEAIGRSVLAHLEVSFSHLANIFPNINVASLIDIANCAKNYRSVIEVNYITNKLIHTSYVE